VPSHQSRKRLIRRERIRIHFGLATTEQGQEGLVQCCLKSFCNKDVTFAGDAFTKVSDDAAFGIVSVDFTDR
jgi:hypothetical protein